MRTWSRSNISSLILKVVQNTVRKKVKPPLPVRTWKTTESYIHTTSCKESTFASIISLCSKSKSAKHSAPCSFFLLTLLPSSSYLWILYKWMLIHSPVVDKADALWCWVHFHLIPICFDSKQPDNTLEDWLSSVCHLFWRNILFFFFKIWYAAESIMVLPSIMRLTYGLHEAVMDTI